MEKLFAFIAWVQITPIIIPNFKNWRPPNPPFSFKTILRREFSTCFAIIAVFFFLEISENIISKKRFFVGRSWLVFFFVSMAVYFTFLILKKKTNILNITGR